MERGSWFTTLVVSNVLWISLVTLFGRDLGFAGFGIALVVVGPSFASLAVYHRALSRIEGSLTTRDVDSVYYAGFLITLLVLIASVYELSAVQTSDRELISLIASKFALGLLVTGYGLFARINLQKRLLDEESMLDGLNRYADSIGILNDRIAESANLISTRLIEILDNARVAGRESTKEMVDVISNDLGPAAEQLKQTITKINRTFGRFEEGRFRELADVSEKLSEELDKLKSALSPLHTKFQQSVAVQEQFAYAFSTLNREAGNASSTLFALGDAAKAGSAAVSELAVSIGKSGEVIEELDILGASIRAAFSEINRSSHELSVQLTSSVGAVQSFVGVLDVTGMRRFADEVVRGADGSARLASELNSSVEQLSQLIGGSNGVLTENVRMLSQASKSMTETTELLSTAMVRLATAIKDAAESAAR
jgi:ABC-type transporter Mla subunit MlaD